MPIKNFLFFVVISCIYQCILCYQQDESKIPDTSSEIYPYLALILQGSEACSGVLIKADYVIVPASCVCRDSKVLVFLGFNKYPYYSSNHNEENGQIIHSNKIIIHDDFIKINNYRYLNNIALIKLSEPVKITKTVHPGKIIHKEENFLLDGKVVHVVGWMLTLNTNIKEAHATLRTKDTCRALFGEQFFSGQESCLNWMDHEHMNLMGNPISIDGKIVGFETQTPPCVAINGDCSPSDMILNFAPYLDWIAYKTQSSISDISAVEVQYEVNNEKLEELLKMFDEVKKVQHENQMVLEETINGIITGMKEHQKYEDDHNLKLDEEFGNFKSEVNNNYDKSNATILKLLEEIGDAKNEFISGLSAEKATHDEMGKIIEELQTKTHQQEKELNNFQEIVTGLKEEIHGLQSRIEQFEIQDKCPTCAKDLETKVFADFDNITHIIGDHHNHVKRDIDHLAGKVQDAILSTHEKYDTVNGAVANLEGGFKKTYDRLDIVEKVLDENRARIDSQILSEREHFHENLRDKEKLDKRITSCCPKSYFDGHYEPAGTY